MLDEHALWHDGARWQWRSPMNVSLPASSYDLFVRRIDRVAPLSRRVLAVAAVIGRRFDIDLLMAAGVWDEDDVLEAIDDGMTAGVIEVVEETEGQEYRFCHSLLHDALRQTNNPRRVQRIHERIAEALERRDPRAAAQLAEHYDLAGNDERAYEHAMTAGANASAVHAPEDAIAFFLAAARHAMNADQRFAAHQSVIRIAERMGAFARCVTYCDTAIAELASEASLEQKLWLDVQRARARFQTGATPTETLACSDELLAEADDLGCDDERVALAILQSMAHARCGDFVAAESAAADAVLRASQSGNEGLHITSLLRHGTMILERDPEEALALFRAAMERAECLGDSHAEARCRVAVGVACARAQHDEAANTAYETARDLAQRIRAPDVAGLAALNLGVLRLHSGQFAQARQELASAVAAFTLVHNEPNRLAALYNSATVESEAGNAAAAADLYAKARDLAVTLGHRDVSLGAAAGAGLAAIRLGRVDSAIHAAQELDALMVDEGARWFQGREMVEALRVRAALETRDVGTAEKRFWAALGNAEKHDQYGAAWFVAEVVTELVEAGCADAWKPAERFAPIVAKLGYASLAARYVVLRDLSQRAHSSMVAER
jgi:tetratricopeptide (TPR) repeat protein